MNIYFFETHFHHIKFSQKTFKLENMKYRIEETKGFIVFVYFSSFSCKLPLKQTMFIKFCRNFGLAPSQCLKFSSSIFFPFVILKHNQAYQALNFIIITSTP